MTCPPRLVLPRSRFHHPGELLEAHYRRQVEGDPHRQAIWTRAHSLTHGELLQATADLQRSVRARAPLLQPGRICGIHCGNSVENLVLGLALLFEGIPQVLIATHATEAEAAALTERCDIGLIATDRPRPPGPGMVRLGRLAGGIELWGREGFPREEPVFPDRSDDLDALLDRTVALSLTSGTTTGVPGVHRAPFFHSLAALQQPAWPAVERTLMTFKLQFGASRGWAMRILLEGGTVCAVREEEAAELPAIAGESGAGAYCASPATLSRLIEQRAERIFPSSLVFMTGSDRVSAGLRKRFHERFGPRLWVLYASSQSGPLSRLAPERLLEEDGEGIGHPLPGVTFTLDPSGLGEGAEDSLGEVVVRKQWVVRLSLPERGEIDLVRTQEDFRPRDLLRRWPDGSYSFAGRANDVFLFRSVLVSPHEIENLLEGDPAVLEVVGFGAHSSTYGAVPMAAVILRPGWDADLEIPRLRRLCQQAMGFRSPKAVLAVAEIPRGPTGKPLRRQLAETHSLS
ncbi:MAG: class I adenylate-forming enzyme family protein [Synechococcaceae cyanobacterium]|nr:class I adenylate-forming enzyme family protein [Synechococcaceae cyanobacterium]